MNKDEYSWCVHWVMRLVAVEEEATHHFNLVMAQQLGSYQLPSYGNVFCNINIKMQSSDYV